MSFKTPATSKHPALRDITNSAKAVAESEVFPAKRACSVRKPTPSKLSLVQTKSEDPFEHAADDALPDIEYAPIQPRQTHSFKYEYDFAQLLRPHALLEPVRAEAKVWQRAAAAGSKQYKSEFEMAVEALDSVHMHNSSDAEMDQGTGQVLVKYRGFADDCV